MAFLLNCAQCGKPSFGHSVCLACYYRIKGEERARIDAEIKKMREHYNDVYSGKRERDNVDRLLGRAGDAEMPVDPLYKKVRVS